jgi:hypothetical protein
MAALGHEPSPRLDDCEGSPAVVRRGSPDVGNWYSSALRCTPAEYQLSSDKLTVGGHGFDCRTGPLSNSSTLRSSRQNIVHHRRCDGAVARDVSDPPHEMQDRHAALDRQCDRAIGPTRREVRPANAVVIGISGEGPTRCRSYSRHDDDACIAADTIGAAAADMSLPSCPRWARRLPPRHSWSAAPPRGGQITRLATWFRTSPHAVCKVHGLP